MPTVIPHSSRCLRPGSFCGLTLLPLCAVRSVWFGLLNRLCILADLLAWLGIHAHFLCLILWELYFNLPFMGLVCHLIAATAAVMIDIRTPMAQGGDAYGDDTTKETAGSSGKATLWCQIKRAVSMGGWSMRTWSDWSLAAQCASVCTLCKMGSQ
jgi:hypothetical protein